MLLLVIISLVVLGLVIITNNLTDVASRNMTTYHI